MAPLVLPSIDLHVVRGCLKTKNATTEILVFDFIPMRGRDAGQSKSL
jgi:hypothetical protein